MARGDTSVGDIGPRSCRVVRVECRQAAPIRSGGDRAVHAPGDGADLVGGGEAPGVARGRARCARRLGRARRRPARRRLGDPRRRAGPDTRARRRDRARDPPRRRGLRRRRRGRPRRGGPLVPLRADLVGRARHGARAAGTRRGRADRRGHRPGVRRRRRARRGAPADADHGPHARDPRRADDVRAQARRLGVRARPGAGASYPCARGHARRQALRRRRHLRGDRSRGRAASRASGSGSSRRRPRRRSSSATATPSCSARSHSSPRRSRRFALEIRHLARTEVGEVAGAVRARPEGLVGDAAQAQPRRLRAHLRPRPRRARPGARRPRERRAVARARHLALVGRARRRSPMRSSRSTTCSTASRWLVEGLVVRPERMRRNLEASHGLFFSQRVLLALVESGLARDDAYRLVQRNAMRAWDEERSTSRARPRRERDRARVDLDAVFDLDALHAPRRHRLRAPRGAPDTTHGRRSMPEAVHVGSGKVRELYALDDEPAAARRQRPHLDLRRRPADPDPGQGPRAHRAVGVLVRADAGRSCRTTCSRSGRTAARLECRRLEMLPIECVVRGYLSGSGWKDYRATGAVCGHRLPEGLRRVRPAAGADLHAGDEGARPATTRTSRATRRPSSSAQTGSRRRERISIALYRFGGRLRGGARDHPRRHEVRVRPRPRRPARARRRGAHAGLVALLAGRRVRAGGAAAVASTSSSCATTARRSAGTRPHPAPSFPTTSSPARARATSRRSSG